MRVVQVDGRSVCVGHTEDDQWGAIDNVCTHDGGVLGDGELDDIPEQAFLNVGGVDQVEAKAKALQESVA